MPVRIPSDIHSKFEDAFNAGDVEALVALYEPEAVLAPQSGQPVTGHDAIRQAYQRFLTTRPTITVETVAVFETGALAMLHGRWTMKGSAPDGSELNTQGRNTEVVRRQADGGWLFVIDIPFTPE